jgi:hypothetical protein
LPISFVSRTTSGSGLRREPHRLADLRLDLVSFNGPPRPLRADDQPQKELVASFCDPPRTTTPNVTGVE